VRQLAQDTSNILWSQHALDQLEGRVITDKEALGVLRRGDIVGPIVAGKNTDEWTCKVCFPVEHNGGTREVGVVTIVKNLERLFVKTVEWENF
jgi:hypothetical protein